MKAALILSACALLVASCGGGDKGPSPVSGSATQWWQDAESAMARAQSYHVKFTVNFDPQQVYWDVDYVAPDSYRFVIVSAQGDRTQQCLATPEGVIEIDGPQCHDAFTSFTTYRVYETILSGDKSYARECQDVDTGCGEWKVGPRPPVALAGPSPTYAPGWPLVALELAKPTDVDGKSKIAGEDVVIVHGTVNHLRAILENERRLLTAAGSRSFGQECTASASITPVVIGDGQPGPAPTSVQECHDLTYEESLQQQEPELSYIDAHPATLAVQVLPDSHLVRRMALTSTAQPSDDEPHPRPRTLLIEYSHYNDVQIEAPTP